MSTHDYFEQYIKAVTQPLPLMKEYFDLENAYLENLVDGESTVHDVGCGNGRTMIHLAPKVKKIVGIDYDEEMYQATKNNIAQFENAEAVLGDFFQFEPKEKYNLVFASYNLLGSMEVAVDKRKELIQKMIDCASSGGHIVISVWSDQGLDFAKEYYSDIGIIVRDIQNNEVITDHGVFKRFTKEELHDLFRHFKLDYKLIELNKIFYTIDISKPRDL